MQSESDSIFFMQNEGWKELILCEIETKTEEPTTAYYYAFIRHTYQNHNLPGNGHSRWCPCRHLRSHQGE